MTLCSRSVLRNCIQVCNKKSSQIKLVLVLYYFQQSHAPIPLPVLWTVKFILNENAQTSLMNMKVDVFAGAVQEAHVYPLY